GAVRDHPCPGACQPPPARGGAAGRRAGSGRQPPRRGRRLGRGRRPPGGAAAAVDGAAPAAAWSAAAEQAMLAFALRDAERLSGEALDAATASGERERVAELRLRRGAVREELADYDGARDDHVAALELARTLGDPRLEARALERLGGARHSPG